MDVKKNEYKGDGICDDGNNNVGCEYDGGDCCGIAVDKTFCKTCACLTGIEGCKNPKYKGDQLCDDGNNNAGCEFDGGDCCGSNVDMTFCSECECLQQ